VRIETTHAIVLRTRDYGESDKVVTVLSCDAGKFSAIAKGAKRSRRRFPGSLEILSHVRVDFRYRQGAELAFLERAILVRPWQRLLSSLERYTAASHVLEVADKLTAEREVGDDLYRLVLATLARIDDTDPGPATLRLFELAGLTASGYRSEFSACRGCLRPVGNDGLTRVAPGGGGLTCRDCTRRQEGGVLISPSSVASLVAMQEVVSRVLASARGAGGNGTSDVGSIYESERALESRLTPLVANELRSALDALLTPHLRSRLRVLELMRSLDGAGRG
jgi:DNA repair protein RecO (recombination protein O)